MSLYRALGCQVYPKRIPGRHHLYVDIVTKENKKSLAECRIGLEDVDKDAVESFASLLKKEKAVEGAIITFGEVTDKARQAGKKKRIYLYDGSDFLGLWNNLHLSDTAPRDGAQAESRVFTEAPFTVPESEEPPAPGPVPIPAWAEITDIETDTGESQGSFLDQIQAEDEQELKSGHSRDEIHRLFESASPLSAPAESIEPVVEKSASDLPSLDETPPEILETEGTDASSVEPSLPFLAEPEIEPVVESQPESLPEAMETLPIVESPEPESMDSEASTQVEISVPNQTGGGSLGELSEPQEEFPPSAPLPLPVLEEPAPPVELPEAPLKSEIKSEVESENVIQRLFGRGFEADTSAQVPLSPPSDEIVDFSIFQIPSEKPNDSGMPAGPVDEHPAVELPPAQFPLSDEPVPENNVEEQPVVEPSPVEALRTEPPVLESSPIIEQPLGEPMPVQAPIEEALFETAPLNPDIVLMADKTFTHLEAELPSDGPEEPGVDAAESNVAAEAEPTEGQFLEGFLALSEEPSAPEASAPEIALPEEQLDLQESVDNSPSMDAPVALAGDEIVAAVEEIRPVEQPVSVDAPVEPSGSLQEIESAAGPAPEDRQPVIMVHHPDQSSQADPRGPDPDNCFLSKAAERLEGDSPCIFITGRTGTGENLLMDYYIGSTTRNVVLLAPTAMGALDIGGQTLRSFFNFREYPVRPNDVQEISDPAQKEIYKHIDTLIIDEIPKVGPNVIDAVDRFMRLNGREPEKAFGGAQVVFFGDLFQSSYNRPDNGMPGLLAQDYRSPFFFDAVVFKQLPIEVVELQKEYDRRDETLAAILNSIRTNALDDSQYKALAARVDPDFTPPSDSAYITLTSTSGVASKINRDQLKQLRSPECLHLAEIEGEFEEGAYPVDRELILRRGAQVVFLKEDYARKWVKGTIAKVTSISESSIQVEIDADGFPFLFRVERETWQTYRYKFDPANGKIEKEMVGEFTQYPLCPGWAMTVQKSQGSRFDNVVIDLSGEEAEAGQLYSALCSCRRLEGIVLKDRISQKYKANAVNRIQEIANLFYQ